jgi:uncharacterized protein
MSFLLRIIIAVVLISLLEYYFVRKIHAALKEYFPLLNMKKLKRYTAFILIFFNFYPAILTGSWIASTIFNTGRIDLPQNFFFNYFITYPFWVGIIIIVQSSLFFIVFDILRGILQLFARRHKTYLRRIELKMLPFIALIFLFYVPLRIVYDYHSIEVNEVIFSKDSIPEELNDFKLVLISDIQADKYTNRYRLGNFIEKVNELNPDLVLIAGDLITSTPRYIDLSAEYTGYIKAKYGVFACVGDHDNWAYREDNARSIREITEALGQKGVKMIDNDSEFLEHNGKKIKVTFITNTYVEAIQPQTLDKIINGGKSADLKIFLTHQPRNYLIEGAERNGYDLYLAGHTHGGQITFFFPFFNISPTLVETKYVRGDFNVNDMMIYVTRGLGMSLVPIRYNSTPEVTLIKFNGRSTAE